MADAKLVARADEVIDRLFALNEAMESADAFCAYLKELNARDMLVKQYLVKPSDVGARHVLSIRWVHAGILRAAIGNHPAQGSPPTGGSIACNLILMESGILLRLITTPVSFVHFLVSPQLCQIVATTYAG
jgi:hypothetical protein